MSYLHGWEDIDVPALGQTIQTVPSAVIALIGITDDGPTQTLTLCQNRNDDFQFAPYGVTPLNNIGKSLNIIRSIMEEEVGDGACTVIVVNVYDPTKHRTVLNQTATPVNGQIALQKQLIGNPANIVIKSGANPIVYTYGVDYTLDKYGNFTDITGTYATTALTFTGYYLTLTDETIASDIIGGVDGDTNVRTGLQLFYLTRTQLNMSVKIVIAPTFSTLTGVGAAMLGVAKNGYGVALIDAPAGTTYPGAIAGRAPAGTIGFNVSDAGYQLCYPQLASLDTITGNAMNYPYSAYLAGMMVYVDLTFGFWYSPSNYVIPNVTGVEIPLTNSYMDANSETNLLNAQGIITYLNSGGYRTWGNRNASFPSSSSPKNFINVYRADQMVKESMAIAGLPYIDQPITKALIDVLLANGNAYMKELIQEGAYVPGSYIAYDPTDNPATDLGNGNIKFRRYSMVTPPTERITEYDYLDITLLNNLNN